MKNNSILKMLICVLLALVMVLCTVSCGSDKTKKKKRVVIKKVIVSSDDGSDTDDNYDDYDYFDDDTDWEDEGNFKFRRELASKDTAVANFVPEFTQKEADWDGPKGYVIVYQDGNKYSNLQARYLQAFFKKTDGVSLKIIDDTVSAVSKEILVGNTNRYTTPLSENQFSVSLKGKKLVFEGGHRIMVEKAVKWFMSIDRVSGKVATLKGKSDSFKSQLSGGYKLVWGEEFDGDFLDQTKFVYNSHMGVGDQHVASDAVDDKLVRVENGLFKMSTKRIFSDTDAGINIGIAKPVCTGDTMQWLYGYAEMRALVPCIRGAWPAWWATSYCKYSPEHYNTTALKYVFEVDFFEVFGDLKITPNIHKWYKTDGGLNTITYLEKNGKQYTHSDYSIIGPGNFSYSMNEITKNEYHIFGFKWTPDEMMMSVDGVDFMTYDLNNNFDEFTDMSHFKNDPMHMILDNWAYFKNYQSTNNNNELNVKDLPFNYYVDYIRLYQRDGEGYVNDFGVNKDIVY